MSKMGATRPSMTAKQKGNTSAKIAERPSQRPSIKAATDRRSHM